jgi:hypothetical protein
MRRAALALVLLAALAVLPARAADVDPAKARAEIQRILATDEFSTTRSEQRWRYIGEAEARAQRGERGPGWLSSLGNSLAALTEVLLWAAVAAALFLLWRYRHVFLGRPATRDADAAPLPDVESGALLRPEDLPADPAAEARRLAAAGRVRDALSLLYRATLARLAQEYALELPEGFTESEALRAVARAARPEHEGFLRAVVGVWQSLAYAGVAPGAPRVEALAEDWQRQFGGAPR